MPRTMAARTALLVGVALCAMLSCRPSIAGAEPYPIAGDGVADGVLRGYVPSGWRSVLYPHDWQPGYADLAGRAVADFSYAGYKRGEEPIPHAAGPAFVDVSSPPYSIESSVTTDVTAVLQQAIDDVGARGGGVVYLPPATYRVSTTDTAKAALTIRHDNVVLRGAGRSRTFIVNTTPLMRGKSVILASPEQPGSWNIPTVTGPANLIRDAKAGSREVTVISPHTFAVGDLIVIRTEATPEWVAERGSLRGWNAATMDATTYLRRVVDLKPGGVLVLDTPLRTDALVRDRGILPNVYRARRHLNGVGIEDLSVGMLEYPDWGYLAYDVHESTAIKLQNVVDSWVQRISTFKPEGNRSAHILSEGIWIDNSRQVTVRECSVAYPQYRGAGNGNGFIIRGSDNLVEGCAAIECRHAYTFGMWQATGNVIRHSVSARPVLKSDFHMWFSAVNLLEGLLLDGHGVDATFRNDGTSAVHGHTTSQSVMWNLIGVRRPTSWQPGPLVDTVQWGWGAAVGTSGPWSSVSNDPSTDALDADWDEDLVEGEGWGATLVPQSLYADQLNRRVGATLPGGYRVRGRVLPVRPGSTRVLSGGVPAPGTPAPEVRVRGRQSVRFTFDLPVSERVTRARLVMHGRVGRRSARCVVRALEDVNGSQRVVTLVSIDRTRAMPPLWVVDVSEYVRQRSASGDSSVTFEVSEALGCAAEIALRTDASRERELRPRLEIETGPGSALPVALVEYPSMTAVSVSGGRLPATFVASRDRALVVDLGSTRTVTGVGVSFGGGTTRFSFAEVESSIDASTWAPVATLTGSGLTDKLEVFELRSPVTARYVRLSGLGTSATTAQSTTALRAIEVYGR